MESKDSTKQSEFNIDKAIGYKREPYTQTLSNNEAILYALSIGFS